MGDHILSASSAIILVEPSHPGNIGAVARAMGNMGATDLRLVNPANPLHPEAIDRATRAESILRQARTFENLETAIADLERVYGTTARERARHDRVIALPELMEEWPTESGKVGLVFGRESSGLTNQELDLCSRLMRIPTFGKVSSLNLSHAVMVSLYEIQRLEKPMRQDTSSSDPLADVDAIQGLLRHLKESIQRTGFLRPHQETEIMERFSNFFAKANPTALEIRMWRGVFHRMDLKLEGLHENSSSGTTSMIDSARESQADDQT